MKRKNDLAIDENTSKQVSFGERIHHETNNDESETTIKEETRSISISPTFNRSSISNSSLSLSSRALSTMFYSQCALSGISSEDADNAILESRSWYHKWWRQQRFQNDDDNNDNNNHSTDNNDRKSSSSWPKKNRRLNNNNKSIDNSYNNSTTGTTEDNNLSEEHHLIPDDDVESLKRQVLKSLHNSGGDVTDVEFLKYLSMLSELYSYMAADKNNLDHLTEEKKDEEEGLLSSEFGAGVWVTLNKPNFQECLGRNPDTGEYMYTLGRMSFDMFRKDLKCSVKGIYNIIEDVPQDDLNIEHFGLTKEDCIDQGIMTYNISVAFTIENTNLKAVMTNYGYLLPDPHIPNRFSIWFTRGILEQDPDDNTDDNNNNNIPTDEWKETFSNSMNSRSMTERAKLFAAKLMLGIKAPGKMEEDGSMEYNLYKPIRGYCDVIYMDDKLRIIKGHHGTIYVLYRISS